MTNLSSRASSSSAPTATSRPKKHFLLYSRCGGRSCYRAISSSLGMRARRWTRKRSAKISSTRPSTRRLTPSGSGVAFSRGCTTAAASSTMLHTCGSASRHYSRSARPRPPMHRVDGVAMTSRESARRRVMMSTQARGEAGPRRLRVGRRAPPAPRKRPEPRGVCFVLGR